MKFIESLRLENGEILNLPLHQKRLDLTLLAHFGAPARIDLARELAHRALPASGLFKIRVTYSHALEAIEIEPYARRKVEHLELVSAEKLDYRFKYFDRSALDALRASASPGAEPVVVQRGLVADGLYANICFFDGLRWLTPEKPLLEGVALAVAIAEGSVSAASITAADVRAGKFLKAKLINCMNLFGETHEILLN